MPRHVFRRSRRARVPRGEARGERLVIDIRLAGFVQGFRLCLTCFSPYQQQAAGGAPSPQRCRCSDTAPPSPRWPNHDIREHLHLCECCGLVPLPSGSKWSVWFCDVCKGRVRAVNHAAGRCVIPTGRHSLMNGVGVSGRELSRSGAARVRALVVALHQHTTGLFSAADHLHAFAGAWRKLLTEEAGLAHGADPQLVPWMGAVSKMRRGPPSIRDDAFDAQVGWFEAGDTQVLPTR